MNINTGFTFANPIIFLNKSGSDITVAGNLKQMLMDLEEPASNLEFRSSIASPSLLIREMTISGE